MQTVEIDDASRRVVVAVFAQSDEELAGITQAVRVHHLGAAAGAFAPAVARHFDYDKGDYVLLSVR